MITATTILGARRAYEFSADSLRLTALSMKPVTELFQQAFGFQIAQPGSPIPTFGDIPATMPPGVVFDYGLWNDPEHGSTPIRFIHVEPRRIVIDVAGSSACITPIYERFRQLVQQLADALKITGDHPIIGEPQRILDYSEITFTASWSPDAVFADGVVALLSRAAGVSHQDLRTVLVPTIYAEASHQDDPSTGAITMPTSQTLQLSPRVATLPNDHVNFSGALLDTDAHLIYLHDLDTILSKR